VTIRLRRQYHRQLLPQAGSPQFSIHRCLSHPPSRLLLHRAIKFFLGIHSLRLLSQAAGRRRCKAMAFRPLHHQFHSYRANLTPGHPFHSVREAHRFNSLRNLPRKAGLRTGWILPVCSTWVVFPPLLLPLLMAFPWRAARLSICTSGTSRCSIPSCNTT